MSMDENRAATVPKVMNAGQVAEYLGISKQGAYNLMNSASFPTLRVGKRLLVSTDRFLEWIGEHSDNIKVEV
ncbi:MAG: helix-turn-helix domain-containing protein [Clostridiales bacterium]|nr:helix-turn-helix domain-containing protein [Clostridiales bacterium]